MSVSPALADLSRLYQTEFVRSARAVGVLWAVCTLCFAIIQVVVLVQPSWMGTTDTRHQGVGPAPPSGTLGLFEVNIKPLPQQTAPVGSFSAGNCSVHWAYILAILGVLDAAILATLAFVLANRQDALLPPDAKDVTTGLLMSA
eukprot:superscaffoldBa00005596_g20546